MEAQRALVLLPANTQRFVTVRATARTVTLQREFSPALEHRLLLLSPLLWGGCLKNGQHTTARKDLSNLAVHRVGDDVHSPTLTVGSNSAERQGHASPQNDLSY